LLSGPRQRWPLLASPNSRRKPSPQPGRATPQSAYGPTVYRRRPLQSARSSSLRTPPGAISTPTSQPARPR